MVTPRKKCSRLRPPPARSICAESWLKITRSLEAGSAAVNNPPKPQNHAKRLAYEEVIKKDFLGEFFSSQRNGNDVLSRLHQRGTGKKSSLQ
jgi:hypothetical protein